jgi:branched-subunit amino acid ABC-type transport system permease component
VVTTWPTGTWPTSLVVGGVIAVLCVCVGPFVFPPVDGPTLIVTKALVGFAVGGVLSLLGALGGARDDGHSAKPMAPTATQPTPVTT